MARNVALYFTIFCYVVHLALASFYDLTVTDANGKTVSLQKYRGKVSLVTNVASYCGYTDGHYKAYVDLQRELGVMFQVLAFPCNQFGEQEPEDIQTIISNMKNKYNVNFEIFGKVDVTGPDAPEVWKYLIDESQTEPKWNFYKYLINAEGQLWGAWGPKVDIGTIKAFIRDAVKQAIQLRNVPDEL